MPSPWLGPCCAHNVGEHFSFMIDDLFHGLINWIKLTVYGDSKLFHGGIYFWFPNVWIEIHNDSPPHCVTREKSRDSNVFKSLSHSFVNLIRFNFNSYWTFYYILSILIHFVHQDSLGHGPSITSPSYKNWSKFLYPTGMCAYADLVR